jgi:hypothetical protein
MHISNRFLALPLMASIVVVLAGCSSAAKPDTVLSSPDVTMVTNPDPVQTGQVELIFTVTDEKGAPLSGAEVLVTADHIGHSGMTLNGAATEQDEGRYAITADISMEGDWEITVQVNKDSTNFSKEFQIKAE